MENIKMKNMLELKMTLQTYKKQYYELNKNLKMVKTLSEKKKITQDMILLQININKVLGIMEETSTVNQEKLLNFLVRYLTRQEQRQYALLDEVIEDDYNLAVATNTYPRNIYGKRYQIIATEEDIERMKTESKPGKLGGDTDNIKDYLSHCRNKFICLKKNDEYTILEEGYLKDELSDFPYLIYVAEEIVDSKLGESFITLQDCFNRLLETNYTKKKNK